MRGHVDLDTSVWRAKNDSATEIPSPPSISNTPLTGRGAPSKATPRRFPCQGGLSFLNRLREQDHNRTLELLSFPARTDDLRVAGKRAAEIAKGAKVVAVLGIGGSSLGGQALTALRKTQIPFVEFHDNPDPFTWEAALKRFDLKKTHFIAISKSGGTAETLTQVLTAAEALKKAGAKNLARHFTIVTEPHQSALADFADSIGAPKLDHPIRVGGRYSVLTMVGVLPALLMGIDVRKLRAGAAKRAGWQP